MASVTMARTHPTDGTKTITTEGIDPSTAQTEDPADQCLLRPPRSVGGDGRPRARAPGVIGRQVAYCAAGSPVALLFVKRGSVDDGGCDACVGRRPGTRIRSAPSRRMEASNWRESASLCGVLERMTGYPMVPLNRAIAVRDGRRPVGRSRTSSAALAAAGRPPSPTCGARHLLEMPDELDAAIADYETRAGQAPSRRSGGPDSPIRSRKPRNDRRGLSAQLPGFEPATPSAP